MAVISHGRAGRSAKRLIVSLTTFTLGASIFFAALGPTPAEAAKKHRVARHGRAAVVLRSDPNKDAALIQDGISGKVLYARNANDIRHPASLTKMMTLYLLFDALKSGQVTMDTTMTFSAHAASQHATNMRVAAGERMDVETAINALVVRSANDVAVMVGETLGGSEQRFAEMMTAKAQSLGMRNTVYRNASGLPDPGQVTTAADLALLARHLAYDFPQYFPFFSHREFTYRGNRYLGHDNLLGRYPGADGMKTGYTDMSGFNLVSSVTRGNTHIIGVVMGGPTAVRRDNEMMRLLDAAFDDISHQPRLVAHAQLPWHPVAGSMDPPVTKVAQLGNSLPVAQTQKGLWQMDRSGDITPIKRPYVQFTGRSDRFNDSVDEEDAETRPDFVAPSRPMPRPTPPKEAHNDKADKVTTVASYTPRPATAPRRDIRRALHADASENTTARETGLHDWTIQIGAYADATLARNALGTYADKSLDVLGQAQKIIVPYQSADGHMVYRARFGPFLEREAKQICARLTERGQTCFAAVSTR